MGRLKTISKQTLMNKGLKGQWKREFSDLIKKSKKKNSDNKKNKRSINGNSARELNGRFKKGDQCSVGNASCAEYSRLYGQNL